MNTYIAIVLDELLDEPMIFAVHGEAANDVTDQVHAFYYGEKWSTADIISITVQQIDPESVVHYAGMPSDFKQSKTHAGRVARGKQYKTYQQVYYQTVTKGKRRRAKEQLV